MNSSISNPLLLHLVIAKFSYTLDPIYKSILFRCVPNSFLNQNFQPKTFKLRIKIRFSCIECNKTWNSYFGTLIINYVLDGERKELLFSSFVYLQNCSNCGKTPHLIGFSEKEVQVNAFLFLQLAKIISPNTVYEESRGLCFAKTNHQKNYCYACIKENCTF